VTSEYRQSTGPNEQPHHLYIDPFYLDRRNFDPDQLFAESSNTRPEQDHDVEFPTAEASFSTPSLPAENTNHLVESSDLTGQQASLRASQLIQQPPDSGYTCTFCAQKFPQRHLLKYDPSSDILSRIGWLIFLPVATPNLTPCLSSVPFQGAPAKVFDTKKT